MSSNNDIFLIWAYKYKIQIFLKSMKSFSFYMILPKMKDHWSISILWLYNCTNIRIFMNQMNFFSNRKRKINRISIIRVFLYHRVGLLLGHLNKTSGLFLIQVDLRIRKTECQKNRFFSLSSRFPQSSKAPEWFRHRRDKLH